MVFIHPCGLHQLFGIGMSLLTNTSMPLSQLLGEDESTALMEQLKAVPDHHPAFGVLNEFFVSRLPAIEIMPKVVHALDYIHQNKGNVSIKEIEANCFITARSLERHFQVYVGLSPNDYVKIFRFKCLMNFIDQNPGLTGEYPLRTKRLLRSVAPDALF